MKALAILAVLLATPGVAATPARPAAVAHDWSATVTRAPGGAYVLGNPTARVRVVEYASLTCSHCAAFAAEGLPALRADTIRRGLVSLELRHAVRDRADLAASLIARCAGPKGYFGRVEKIFAAQAQWLPRAAALDVDDADTPAARQAALLATASGAGLPAIVGLSPAAAAACIGNRAEQGALAAMTAEAWGTRKITGTPTFLINDRAVEGASWMTLSPQIAAALR
ncbi:thioredoxin domain-containing protein [Sphingomonas solaris]|uniref:thioredoxin domain-containing protein n=1 Tax=Alterirhizorhabdus solaris TaxID=2529389 RepID=UPI00139692AD|nr:thioredoxin domain-containing protein [Sphingomonas solaris]